MNKTLPRETEISVLVYLRCKCTHAISSCNNYATLSVNHYKYFETSPYDPKSNNMKQNNSARCIRLTEPQKRFDAAVVFHFKQISLHSVSKNVEV